MPYLLDGNVDPIESFTSIREPSAVVIEFLSKTLTRDHKPRLIHWAIQSLWPRKLLIFFPLYPFSNRSLLVHKYSIYVNIQTANIQTSQPSFPTPSQTALGLTPRVSMLTPFSLCNSNSRSTAVFFPFFKSEICSMPTSLERNSRIKDCKSITGDTTIAPLSTMRSIC